MKARPAIDYTLRRSDSEAVLVMRCVRFLFVSAALALTLSACAVYSKAIPIGDNTYLIETDGRGTLGAALVSASTLRDAATLALDRGYGNFLVEPAPDKPVNIGTRAVFYGSTRSVVYTSNVLPPATTADAAADSTFDAPPTVRTRIAVVMIGKDDPRLPRSYNALQVLAGSQ